jgi:hypothetical protein
MRCFAFAKNFLSDQELLCPAARRTTLTSARWCSSASRSPGDRGPARLHRLFLQRGLRHRPEGQGEGVREGRPQGPPAGAPRRVPGAPTSQSDPALEALVQALAAQHAVGTGDYIHPARLALSGTPLSGPSFYGLLGCSAASGSPSASSASSRRLDLASGGRFDPSFGSLRV